MGWIIFSAVVVLLIYAAVRLSDWRYKKAAGKLATRLSDREDELVEHIRMLRKDLAEVEHNKEFSDLLEILIQNAQTTLHRINAGKDLFRHPHRVVVPSVQRELHYIDEDVLVSRRSLFAVARALKNINIY